MPSHTETDLIHLSHQLGQELGRCVGVACTDVTCDYPLWPDESAAVQTAIPRRKREFAAGRHAAREAMARIGHKCTAIPSASDRSPVWPDGLVGSIAHNARVCIAVVGRREEVCAVGVDVEDDRPLESDLWRTICTREELAIAALLPHSDRGFWVTRLFCAKEAYYKWQYPQTGRMLDFSDVQITFSEDHTTFHARRAEVSNSKVLPSLNAGQVRTLEGLTLSWLVGPPVGAVDGEFPSVNRALLPSA